MSALLLFDIDGTLLLSGGAGVRAMALAFEALFGVRDAFSGVPIAGHTDRFLVSRALARAGLDDTPAAHARFRDAYLQRLPEEILKPGTGSKGLMPGVRELLARVAAHGHVHVALLTGNYEPAAHIKLRHFGIGDHFAWGAFGEDSPDRNELARLALARAAARDVPAAALANVIVIGDTPQDVDCARAIGGTAIAVATGNYSVGDLRAHGADVAVADLSDAQGILDRL